LSVLDRTFCALFECGGQPSFLPGDKNSHF
jgi:hypothetical protein